jgi:hypothetical protein
MKLNDKSLKADSFLCHSDVMEERMPVSLRPTLALGLALAVPAAAYASPPHHRYGRAHHGTVIYQAAAAGARVSVCSELRLLAPPYTPSHRQYEVEGLTRNTDDCARYGCIGNN